MDLKARLTAWLEGKQRGARGIWTQGERTHLELFEVEPDELPGHAEKLRAEVEAIEGVRWARLNGALARLVVEHEASLDPSELVASVERVERQVAAGPRFLRACPAYPGDHDPVARNRFEMAADALSLVVATGRRLADHSRSELDVDFAALVTLLEGIPRVKQSLADRASKSIADLTLELAKNTSQIVTMSESGPFVSALRHGLRFSEARARERVWAEREPELCADPEAHPLRFRRRRRRRPLRKGLLERYDDFAVPAAVGTFALGMWFTKSVQDASPALFAGLPRAPHQTLSAFGSTLGYVFARRDVLVLDGEALRRLDRIDALVLSTKHLDDESALQRVVRRAREIDLRVYLVGKELPTWSKRKERIEKKKVGKVIRKLQRDGSGVALVASGRCKAYAQADLSLALSAPAWGAHILAKNGLHDALWLVDAVAAAREVTRQSVALAGLEATTGLVLSFAGLRRETADRNMSLANFTALLAMLNGARIAHGLDREPPPPSRSAPPHHAMSVDEVLESLDASIEGLAAEQARLRKPPAAPRPSRLRRFGAAVWKEVDNPMTPILGLGAGLSASVGSKVDAGLIVGAAALNGLVGGVQRHGAEGAIAELARREERSCRVVRDGASMRVAPSDLVVGDILELEAGEMVPADCRILEAVGLEADEAALTGESLPVPKSSDPSSAEAVAERSSMLYAETSIAAGSARAIVVSVGDDTEAGRARLAAGTRTEASGVEGRLQRLSSLTIPVAGASALALLASGLVRGRAFEEVAGAAVGLGVAAVPEGLPLLATLAQLAAAKRLSDKGVLVRNPRSLEPLGRVDVLCADKTGTLTEGNIRLAVVSDGKRRSRLGEVKNGARRVLSIALRATPKPNGEPLAHPTDEALVAGLGEMGLDEDHFARVDELPFRPGRPYHATLGRADGVSLLAVKGAPEVVLARCRRFRAKGKKASRRTIERLLEEARALGRDGYRVLAVAERRLEPNGGLDDGDVRDLTFRGFVGLADPVRGRSQAAIAKLKRAGVRTVMITGDHPSTARAIAGELELEGPGTLTGAEVEALDDEALADRLEQTSVVARVTPVQKVRLVRVLRSRGHTVAMTGDGANDAAAIELADVGIALGENSTAAARNAADLVVTDGRIETIVEAVLEGRSLWASVRDAVSILVGGNLGEIAFTLVAGLATGDSPLNARQLLLVNLVTDTLPALAIAVQPPRPDRLAQLIDEGPEASLGGQLDAAMLRRASLTAGAAGAAYLWARLSGCGPEKASTVGLLTLTGAQLGQTLVVGGKRPEVVLASLVSMGALFATVELPGVSHFFGCRPLGPIALFEAATSCVAATAVAALLDRRAERSPEPEPEPVREVAEEPLPSPSEVTVAA